MTVRHPSPADRAVMPDKPHRGADPGFMPGIDGRRSGMDPWSALRSARDDHEAGIGAHP